MYLLHWIYSQLFSTTVVYAAIVTTLNEIKAPIFVFLVRPLAKAILFWVCVMTSGVARAFLKLRTVKDSVDSRGSGVLTRQILNA